MTDMKYIMAIDPGKLTGVAVFTVTEDGTPVLEGSAELHRDEFESWLEGWLLGYSEIEVVAERYVIGDADSPWSLRMLGVLSYLSRKGGHGEPVLQTPADAKSFCTNERLKHLGYWHVGGEGHANDAIRHGVLYMVKQQLIPAAAVVL